MTLYVKAGQDGISVGDCPFAHYIRLVLEEKGLEYDVKPSVGDTKPNWLVEHYDGKLPALQHRKECYVESGVIAEYLDFFFPTPSLKAKDKNKAAAAEEAIDGLFPAVAKYLKTDGDDQLLENLQTALTKLETYLSEEAAEGDYLCGDNVCMLDLGLMPKLYHLQVGIEGFKDGVPSMTTAYPLVSAYMERATARPSFQATVYPKETVLWGWGNARS
jgi:glutathione S-transferase